MLLTCPICRAECTIDNLSVDTVTCPTCGQQLSTRTGSPVSQVVIGDTPAAKDETREWHEEVVSPTADIDVLPVRLGRYFIESLIAQGGFAKVYLATDEELGRRVALKIPRLEKFKTPAKLRQFLAEARIAAKLRHPGIVTIFDVGQFANGTNYIAMEYVAGQSLSDLMQAGRISLQRAVDLMIKIAEAVHEAHRQSLVHRDLKPGNILLDERGEPRVVDFGLAVHETAQAQLQGEVAGTPAFMSPEQFRGEVHRLDGRTDIWSLGCVFYQLLTGRRPFNGDVTQLYDEVLNKAPKPPRQIDDQIPRELETICFKCLSKDVDARYTTAKDLADDLRTWLSLQSKDDEQHLTVPAQQTNQAAKLRPWLVASIGAILCGTGAVLLAINLPSQPRTDDQPGGVGPGRNNAQVLDKALLGGSVDQRATPRVWLPLLDRKPEQIVWGGDTPTCRWSFDPLQREIVVDAGYYLFAGIGETKSDDFGLQLTLTKNAFSGIAGLFWGFNDAVRADGTDIKRCDAVVIQMDEVHQPKTYRILRMEFEFVTPLVDVNLAPIADLVPIAGLLTFVEIPCPERTELKLEVHVKSGLVRSVLWQQQELPTLADDQEARPSKSGKFGVLNEFGATRFFDARFKTMNALNP